MGRQIRKRIQTNCRRSRTSTGKLYKYFQAINKYLYILIYIKTKRTIIIQFKTLEHVTVKDAYEMSSWSKSRNYHQTLSVSKTKTKQPAFLLWDQNTIFYSSDTEVDNPDTIWSNDPDPIVIQSGLTSSPTKRPLNLKLKQY